MVLLDEQHVLASLEVHEGLVLVCLDRRLDTLPDLFIHELMSLAWVWELIISAAVLLLGLQRPLASQVKAQDIDVLQWTPIRVEIARPDAYTQVSHHRLRWLTWTRAARSAEGANITIQPY
jgi:hypothetical protein